MKKKVVKKKFVIIQDTREKSGWGFEDLERCKSVTVETMKTGDYTIKGLEEEICIERKARTSELATNLGKHRKRFETELERMTEYPHRFLLLEFDVDDLLRYPFNSGIPPSKWKSIKVRGPYMLSLLTKIQLKYGVHVIFCGDKENAERIAGLLFGGLVDGHG